MKKYISPEAKIITINFESECALATSEQETGAGGMQSNHRINVEWDDDDDEF